MFKTIFKIFFLTFFFFGCAATAQDNEKEPRFLSGFEDIPLMENVFESEDNNIVIDNVYFKIIETYVYSENVKMDQFFNFYDKTLKQLGYSKIGVYNFKPHNGKETEIKKKVVYKRDNEELTVDVIKKDPLLVMFLLNPLESGK